ncbi:protein hemingway-like [Vanessa cardui]|uniref:protein hemingway-like n=1 Tax=Vanessa cardui TaxID=171605 RepID=UPI001F146CF9|nr:protein hemingway-like [Vanessa cardui]XP_046970712.1 protein hemingway-like [Vanessa cardui]
MSLGENLENISGYIDREYSAGDSNKMKCKQFYQEENNNEVDELSKELSEMGCIVDAVKRPPNICVETCVYEESGSDNENDEKANDNEDIHYSDEFEEGSETEIEQKSNNILNNSPDERDSNKRSVKLSKSQSSMSTNKPPSVSGRSTDYGSISVPQTRRINMSFTNERLREIERHNHILLNKILSARNKKKSSIPNREQPPRRPLPPAAVHRKMQQRKIDHDNMILLKKIQRAKSSACSFRR